jgi:hypothetical protein
MFLSTLDSESGISTGDINSTVVEGGSIPAVPVLLPNFRESDQALSFVRPTLFTVSGQLTHEKEA